MVRVHRHYQKRPGREKVRVNLNPEVSQGLLAILLFIIAGLSILSFFSMAGVAGIFIDSTLALIFGQVRYVFPIVTIVIATLLIKDLEYNYRNTHTLGAFLFFLSFNGLVHIQNTLDTMYSQATLGFGGGFVGIALSWPLLKYVGYWGGTLIILGLLLVSFVFLFNTSLAQMVNLNKKFFMMLGWLGNQIIAFFAKFKKTGVGSASVKFSIKGEYEPKSVPNNENEIEEEDEKRIFHKKSIQDTTGEGDEEVETTEIKNDSLEKIEEVVEEKPDYTNYKLPPVSLLFTSKSKPTSGDIKGNAETIKDTFQNFGIEVDMGEVRVGPTVTQYSLKPAKGIKLTRITTLCNDLSLALAAHPIRIEAPIPGQSLVGIEVPNEKVAMVTLKELLESKEFSERPHNMHIALGKDVAGKVWFADLLKMPHLLIAGATGSGKTVCINTVILSLLYQNSPEILRFIFVDPKRVELTLYNGIPHLLTPVITDAAKTVNALKWTIAEMERRFTVLAAAGKRDIQSYNKVANEKLPYIVFVIDELADLMASAASEVEAGIIRIAQMARAVGIHLIVATQRPSVEVITGLMKANIPARIAFSVASLVDSRTILDCQGAEKLLGRGDMLFLTADLSKPKRVQGAFVSEEEMKRVVNNIKNDEPPQYDDAVVSKNASSNGGTVNLFGGANDDQDSLFDEAKRVVVESGKASASLLQRRLRVGYARAARLLDELEEAGIVGPADGAKPRELFTEHLSAQGGFVRPKEEEEIPVDEQTLDSGGTVFNDLAEKE
ncbi:MAG: DNA translocase FtsK 4TM domain-containing protein [Candidatus Magasanikbacteria bacterium]|jgi:S-DNA-T family DNA segregation ATPase FtsK/SpoIIIE